MAILQGNTYLLPVKVLDCNDNELDINMVEKGEFTFGDLVKLYGEDGEVSWDENHKVFIVPLTEKETFAFEDLVEYQGRLLLKDGGVSGSIPKAEYVYKSIGKTILSEDGAGLQSGKILVMRLMKEFSYGGGTTNYPDLDNLPSINGVELVGNKTSEELGLVGADELTDCVKNEDVSSGVQGNKIVQRDANAEILVPTNPKSVNAAVNKNYVDQKVADLIGAAPETLDTLGEVAQAIADNESVVDALNGAIGNKADKTELANYVKNTDIDYAVKKGITTNTETLTDEEKAAAQSWLGIEGGGDVDLTPIEEDITALDGRVTTLEGKENATLVIKQLIDSSYKLKEDDIVDISGAGQTAIAYNGNTAKTTPIFMSISNLLPVINGHNNLVTRVTTLENAEAPEVDTTNLVSKEDFDKLVNNETILRSNSYSNSFYAGIPINDGTESGRYNIFIGGHSLNNTKGYTVGIGRFSYAGENAVSIGYQSKAEDNSVAIGKSAYATGNNKNIQLGTGTNSTANTLQVFNDNIYNHNTHTLTVQNIELNGEDLADKLANSSVDLNNYYTKEEIDTMLGDISTLLDDINGEVV